MVVIISHWLEKLVVSRPLRYLGENTLLYYAWHVELFIKPFQGKIIKMLGLSGKMSIYITAIILMVLIFVVLTPLNEVMRRTKWRVALGVQNK